MGKAYKNQTADLDVVELSKQGNGLAFLEREGLPPAHVEIPFTMPGDQVRAKLLGKRGHVYYAELQEILRPSPDRQKPRCGHFGLCGGCRYQHMSYEYQLKHKEDQVRKLFSEHLHANVHFHPILPCQQPWNYRNKMEYTFYVDKSGKKCLGLVKEGFKGQTFDLKECHLTQSWFVQAVQCVQKWWAQSNLSAHHNNKGTLQTLILREGQRTGDRMVILNVTGHSDYALGATAVDGFVAAIKQALEASSSKGTLTIYLRIKQAEEGMTTSVYDMLLFGPGHIRETLNIQVNPNEPTIPLHFQIGPSDFFQPNPAQTEFFYSHAFKMANISKNSVVYDLYCGTGPLGISASKYVKQVIGIEVSPESAANARNNAKRNNCNNVTILSGAVRHTLQQIPEQKIPPPDLLIINPPRVGIDAEVIQNIFELSPHKILYISCNPASQVNDVASLERNGFRLITVQPVDQFPYTNQIENICILTR